MLLFETHYYYTLQFSDQPQSSHSYKITKTPVTSIKGKNQHGVNLTKMQIHTNGVRAEVLVVDSLFAN